jgi:hypothetical protein
MYANYNSLVTHLVRQNGRKKSLWDQELFREALHDSGSAEAISASLRWISIRSSRHVGRIDPQLGEIFGSGME